MHVTEGRGGLEQFDQLHAAAVEALRKVASGDVPAFFLVVASDVEGDSEHWGTTLFYSCPDLLADDFDSSVRRAAVIP